MEKIELKFKEMQVFFLTCGKQKDGEFVYADNKKGWFVENRGNNYNAQLFAQGIKEIFKIEGKRGAFLQKYVTCMARTFEEEFYRSEVIPRFNCQNKRYCSEDYSGFIRYVCKFA